MSKRLLIAALAITGAAAHAQFVVVPNAYENTAASTSGLNTFIRDSGNARTGQLGIAASQLTGVNVGDFITGMSFRLWTGATANFPPTEATWASFTINMGVGVAPGAMTTTFANNFIGGTTTVRSGALVVAANSYTAGSTFPTPNAWGAEITFQTGYQYTGGDLMIEVRHGGSNIVNNPANDFLEVALQTDPGYGVNFRSITAVGEQATVGANANFTVTRLTTSPVPEPATFVALGLGLAGLALARRRK